MVLFKGEARYPDLESGYELYKRRSVKTDKENLLDQVTYNRIVKQYCKELAGRLLEEGVVDLPNDIGCVAAVEVTKRATYDRRQKKYRSVGLVDWNATREAGEIVRKDGNKTLGFVFSPKRVKGHNNLRCFGIRANKALYKKVRAMYDEGDLPFYLADAETYFE